MRFSEVRLYELFSSWNVHYHIPRYQRAYEWDTYEKKKRNQVKEFWEDIQEFQKNGVEFLFGNIILFTSGDRFEIVDGQQRLSTVLIFMSALIERYEALGKKEIALELRKKYMIFQDGSYKNIKFQPQEYDRNFWQDIIVENKECENTREPETPSQQRICDAKRYLSRKLEKLSFEEIDKLRETIENALVGKIELAQKKESGAIFELQNDRGKALTNLDKLKSFFIYQIMICGGSEEDIEYIFREFSSIYTTINNFRFLDEDDVLLYHVQAFTDLGYEYRNIAELKEIFKPLDPDSRSKKMREFAASLALSYKALKEFEDDNQEYSCFLKDLRRLKFAFIYPFLLKTYRFFKNKDRIKILANLDRLVFIHNVAFTRADIRTRIGKFLKKFDENVDIDSFFSELFEQLLNERYWRWSAVEPILKDGYWYEGTLSRYILKRYELDLRKKKKEGYAQDFICRMDIYKGDEEKRTGWWLEHIAPITRNNQKENGYDIRYDKTFKERYLHSLGNLLLTSSRHNIALGNRSFFEKLDSYRSSTMLHHKDVENFVDKNSVWSIASIEKRESKIVDFVKREWFGRKCY